LIKLLGSLQCIFLVSIVQVDCVLFAAMGRRGLVLHAEHFQKCVFAEPQMHNMKLLNFRFMVPCISDDNNE
jgi:hypothetical protein